MYRLAEAVSLMSVYMAAEQAATLPAAAAGTAAAVWQQWSSNNCQQQEAQTMRTWPVSTSVVSSPVRQKAR